MVRFFLQIEVLIEKVIEIGKALLLDVKRGDEGGVRMVDPFAASRCFLPIVLIAQVMDPPGKGAALLGPRLIDRTLVVLEKNAVARIRAV